MVRSGRGERIQRASSAMEHLVPVQVSGLHDIVAVSAGGEHNLALKSDGTVWAWGANDDGQLGDGTRRNRLEPIQISSLSKIVAVLAERDKGGASFVAPVWFKK